MRKKSFFFSFFLCLHIPLTSLDNEVVFSKYQNLINYEIKQKSFCKKRSSLNRVIWSEDFINSSLSESIWSYEISNGFMHRGRYISGWGNEELQYYQKGRGVNFTNDNLFIEDGFLKIQPIFHKDGFKEFKYTSARINTKNKLSFNPSTRLTFCFKAPKGTGAWPAFWLMPSNKFDWPQGGEIDILEHRGRIPNVVSSALHFGKSPSEKSTLVGEVSIPEYVNFQEYFHSITFEWKENLLNFYLDDAEEPYWQIDSKSKFFKEFSFPFNNSFYLIINVAVGGIYDQSRVDSKAFCMDKFCSNKSDPDHARFIIDWIEYSSIKD